MGRRSVALCSVSFSAVYTACDGEHRHHRGLRSGSSDPLKGGVVQATRRPHPAFGGIYPYTLPICSLTALPYPLRIRPISASYHISIQTLSTPILSRANLLVVGGPTVLPGSNPSPLPAPCQPPPFAHIFPVRSRSAPRPPPVRGARLDHRGVRGERVVVVVEHRLADNVQRHLGFRVGIVV